MLEAPTMYRPGDPAGSIFDRLRVVIYGSECAPSGELKRETKLRDLGDSLQLVRLAIDIEEEFGVVIDDDTLENWQVVADIERFLACKASR